MLMPVPGDEIPAIV